MSRIKQRSGFGGAVTLLQILLLRAQAQGVFGFLSTTITTPICSQKSSHRQQRLRPVFSNNKDEKFIAAAEEDEVSLVDGRGKFEYDIIANVDVPNVLARTSRKSEEENKFISDLLQQKPMFANLRAADLIRIIELSRR